MIATITLNPCLDKHIDVSGLVANETNRSAAVRQDAGGKGIDVSRAVHEMGGSTIAYGFIGGHEGRTLEILLAEEGVPFSFTPIDQETRACFIINDTKNSQQTQINTPGPKISAKEMDSFFRHLWQINPSPDLMVAGGSVPPGCPPDIYRTIIRDAREHGVNSILDSSGKQLKEGIKARPHLIKPNIREAEELLGTELASEAAIIQAALDIVGMGVEIAVISRGKHGIIAASREQIVKAVPPPVKVKSAVGAGDCAVAGLALKLTSGEPLLEACRLAVAMGTAAVLTPDTELCRRADVEKLLPRIEVREIAAPPGARMPLSRQ